MKAEACGTRRSAGGTHRRMRSLLGLLILFPMWQGCATAHRFSVDAVKNEVDDANCRSYVMVTAAPAQAPADCGTEEAMAYVRTALSAKGMYEAPRGTPADVVIEVDFGTEAPQHKTYSFREPVVENVTRSETVCAPVIDSEGRMTTAEQPFVWTEEVVEGMQIVTDVVHRYPKFLRITARETPAAAGDHPPRELWSVYVTNEDPHDDLAKYLPLLVAAAMDSLDENASGTQEIVIRDGDERVTFVLRGI